MVSLFKLCHFLYVCVMCVCVCVCVCVFSLQSFIFCFLGRKKEEMCSCSKLPNCVVLLCSFDTSVV